MSEILGYDCDGKPLRAGDRVVTMRPTKGPHFHNADRYVWTVSAIPVQPQWRDYGNVVLMSEHPDCRSAGAVAPSNRLRRIDDRTDHQLADEEFTEWLRGLKSGVPA